MRAISVDNLSRWLDNIAQGVSVWVPQDIEGTRLLAPYHTGDEISLGGPCRLSAKEFVFPKTEYMLRFEYHKSPDDPENVTIDLKSAMEAPRTIAFGITPCDVQGIKFLDEVFAWQGSGVESCGPQGYQDPYFKARRANCLLVAVSCLEPDNTCFCQSMGGSPVEAPGADLLLTRINHEYVIEVLTKRGGELIVETLCRELDKSEADALESAKRKAGERQELLWGPQEVEDLAPRLGEAFEHRDWKPISANCYSCGICTYLCPTCHCFNIADEARGSQGGRMRCWDTCMFPLYSLEASGHNPREALMKRYRNRIEHKFNYLIASKHVFGCVGCGRCVRHCPAGLDLRQVVLHFLKLDLKEVTT